METIGESELEMYSEEENQKTEEISEEFFKKAAKIMFHKKTTTAMIMQGKIFDLMQNGQEIAVVFAKDFFNLLEEAGISISKDIRATLLPLFSFG